MWVVFICENFHKLSCYIQILNKAMQLRCGPVSWRASVLGLTVLGAKELHVTELDVWKTFTLTNVCLTCYDVGNSEKEAL